MEKDLDKILANFKIAVETDGKLSTTGTFDNILTNKLIEDAKKYDLDTIIEIIINFPQFRSKLVAQFEKKINDDLYEASRPTGWENVDMSNPSNW